MTNVYLRGSQSNKLFLPIHHPLKKKVSLWIKDLLISQSLKKNLKNFNLKSFLPIFKKKKQNKKQTKHKTNITKHKIHPHLDTLHLPLFLFFSGDMAR